VVQFLRDGDLGGMVWDLEKLCIQFCNFFFEKMFKQYLTIFKCPCKMEEYKMKLILSFDNLDVISARVANDNLDNCQC